jgi:hypothetical protein
MLASMSCLFYGYTLFPLCHSSISQLVEGLNTSQYHCLPVCLSSISFLFILQVEVEGALNCVGDHILREFITLFLTRFRTYKNA